MPQDKIYCDKVKARPPIESHINRMSKFDYKSAANLSDSAKKTLQNESRNLEDRRGTDEDIDEEINDSEYENEDEFNSEKDESSVFLNNYSRLTEHNSLNSTNISFPTLNENSLGWDSQFSSNFSGRGSTPVQTSSRLNRTNQTEDPRNGGFSKFFAYVLIGIVIGFFVHIFTSAVPESNVQNTEIIEKQIKEKLTNLIEKYPSQDAKIWPTLHAGIQDAIELNVPSTFLLIHKNNRANASALAKSIAKIAVSVLNSKYPYPLELHAKDLNTNELISDHGKFILKYKSEIRDRGVIIVYDLEQLDPEVARAFHNLCDNITPLVPRSVIIFTLEVNDLDDKETYIAEERLTEIWGAMNEDIRRPLITRLTGRVLKIVAE